MPDCRAPEEGPREGPRVGPLPSLDRQALEGEVQGAAWRDAPGREAAGSVALVGRDDELTNLAHLHAQAALVPARDDPTDAGLVLEGLLARVLRAPELLARLRHDTGGVDRDRGPLGHLRS